MWRKTPINSNSPIWHFPPLQSWETVNTLMQTSSWRTRMMLRVSFASWLLRPVIFRWSQMRTNPPESFLPYLNSAILICSIVFCKYMSIIIISVPGRVLNMWNAGALLSLRVFMSSGGVVVKLLAYGARGPGFDSRSRRYDTRDWLCPA